MAERNLLEKYAREGAQRFPAVPRTPAGLRSNVAEAAGFEPAQPEGHRRVQTGSARQMRASESGGA